MSEYRCVECETPHDNQEDANLCCACPNCPTLQEQIKELTAENERLKEAIRKRIGIYRAPFTAKNPTELVADTALRSVADKLEKILEDKE